MRIGLLLSLLSLFTEAQDTRHRHGSQRLHKLHRRFQMQNDTPGATTQAPVGPAALTPPGNVVVVSKTVYNGHASSTRSDLTTADGSDSSVQPRTPLLTSSSTEATGTSAERSSQAAPASSGTVSPLSSAQRQVQNLVATQATPTSAVPVGVVSSSPAPTAIIDVASPASLEEPTTATEDSPGQTTTTQPATSSGVQLSSSSVTTGISATDSDASDSFETSPAITTATTTLHTQAPSGTSINSSATTAASPKTTVGASYIPVASDQTNSSIVAGDPDSAETTTPPATKIATSPTVSSSDADPVPTSSPSGLSDSPTSTVKGKNSSSIESHTKDGPSPSPVVDANSTMPTNSSTVSSAGLLLPLNTTPTGTLAGSSSLPTNTSQAGETTSSEPTSSDTLSGQSSMRTTSMQLPSTTTTGSSTTSSSTTSSSTTGPTTSTSSANTDNSSSPTMVLPSVIITQPPVSTSQETTGTSSTQEASTVTTTPAPTNTVSTLPAAIAPPQGIVMPNSSQTLVQIGFDQALNFPFVVSNALSTAQILTFLPEAVSSALNISAASVFSNSLRSYPKDGYSATVAYLVIPNTETMRLAALWNNTQSALYDQSNESIQTLVVLIDTSIPFFLASTTSVVAGTSDSGSGSATKSTNNAASYGGLADVNTAGATDSVQKVAGIGFGAAAAAGAYGGFMFLVARRRRRQRHPRRFSRVAPSIAGSATGITTRWGAISAPMNPENSLGI